MFRFSAICTVALSLLVAAPTMAADADNTITPRGLLDEPINLPAQASSAAERAAARRELRRQARQEMRQLRRLNENQLRRRARDESNRLAQLVLAERLAAEAQRWASVPDVGNDALSEALQWYAIAAKRGTPGTAAIDSVLPSFPVKSFRQ